MADAVQINSVISDLVKASQGDFKSRRSFESGSMTADDFNQNINKYAEVLEQATKDLAKMKKDERILAKRNLKGLRKSLADSKKLADGVKDLNITTVKDLNHTVKSAAFNLKRLDAMYKNGEITHRQYIDAQKDTTIEMKKAKYQLAGMSESAAASMSSFNALEKAGKELGDLATRTAGMVAGMVSVSALKDRVERGKKQTYDFVEEAATRQGTRNVSAGSIGSARNQVFTPAGGDWGVVGGYDLSRASGMGTNRIKKTAAGMQQSVFRGKSVEEVEDTITSAFKTLRLQSMESASSIAGDALVLESALRMPADEVLNAAAKLKKGLGLTAKQSIKTLSMLASNFEDVARATGANIEDVREDFMSTFDSVGGLGRDVVGMSRVFKGMVGLSNKWGLSQEKALEKAKELTETLYGKDQVDTYQGVLMGDAMARQLQTVIGGAGSSEEVGARVNAYLEQSAQSQGIQKGTAEYDELMNNSKMLQVMATQLYKGNTDITELSGVLMDTFHSSPNMMKALTGKTIEDVVRDVVGSGPGSSSILSNLTGASRQSSFMYLAGSSTPGMAASAAEETQVAGSQKSAATALNAEAKYNNILNDLQGWLENSWLQGDTMSAAVATGFTSAMGGLLAMGGQGLATALSLKLLGKGGSILGKVAGLFGKGGAGAAAAGVTGAVASKVAGKGALDVAEHAGIAVASKTAGKMAAKSIGKSILKKIPVLGLLVGLGLAGKRAMEGDFVGAGLEAASGAASTFLPPGVGLAASVAIESGLAYKDSQAGPEQTKEQKLRAQFDSAKTPDEQKKIMAQIIEEQKRVEEEKKKAEFTETYSKDAALLADKQTAYNSAISESKYEILKKEMEIAELEKAAQRAKGTPEYDTKMAELAEEKAHYEELLGQRKELEGGKKELTVEENKIAVLKAIFELGEIADKGASRKTNNSKQQAAANKMVGEVATLRDLASKGKFAEAGAAVGPMVQSMIGFNQSKDRHPSEMLSFFRSHAETISDLQSTVLNSTAAVVQASTEEAEDTAKKIENETEKIKAKTEAMSAKTTSGMFDSGSYATALEAIGQDLQAFMGAGYDENLTNKRFQEIKNLGAPQTSRATPTQIASSNLGAGATVTASQGTMGVDQNGNLAVTVPLSVTKEAVEALNTNARKQATDVVNDNAQGLAQASPSIKNAKARV